MKRNLLALSAFVLAIAFSAFTTKNSAAPKRVGAWYTYNSTTFSADAEKNPANYSLGFPGAGCPTTQTKLCALFIDPAATGSAALEESDITTLLNSTTDPDSDGIFEVEVSGIVDTRN